jgi:molecular chaperone GrpE
MNEAERSPEGTGNGCPADGDSLSPENVSGLSGQDEAKKVYDELNDRFLRLAADFENFRRRTSRERESLVASANERFAVDLLEVMDNFERALKADDSHLREGLEQIRQLMRAQFERHGITSVDSLNKPFNPVEHDAVAHVPSVEPEGMVIDEIARGYTLNGKVIRHAKVAVSKGNQDYQR